MSDDVPEKEDAVINFVSRYPRRNRRPPTHIKSYSLNLTSMKTNYMPSLKEAMASPDRIEWILAILREMHELKERETFILVPRPPNARVLPCKFVSKIKRNTDGTISLYKARLVACGNLQKKSEYDATFSPVIDFTTVRIVLSLALLEGSDVYQLDVTGTFFYGKIDETVYMSQPKGFEVMGQEELICHLRKVITA